VQFRNTTGGTLPAGGSLVLDFKAVLGGVGGNVANSAISVLQTPLAGVSIENDEQTPWYDTAGVDEEFDATLQERNRTKWALLSIELVGDAYRFLALDNGASKVSLDDQNPRGAGTIDVYVASTTGLLGTPEITALQALFASYVFQTDATWPASADSAVSVEHPSTEALDITGTVYHDGAVSDAAMQGLQEDALRALLATVPLGGFDYTPGPANVITVDDILEVMRAVPGVQSVVLSAPSASVAVTPNALVTEGTWTITGVTVTT
jgi:hypothetical protein